MSGMFKKAAAYGKLRRALEKRMLEKQAKTIGEHVDSVVEKVDTATKPARERIKQTWRHFRKGPAYKPGGDLPSDKIIDKGRDLTKRVRDKIERSDKKATDLGMFKRASAYGKLRRELEKRAQYNYANTPEMQAAGAFGRGMYNSLQNTGRSIADAANTAGSFMRGAGGTIGRTMGRIAGTNAPNLTPVSRSVAAGARMAGHASVALPQAARRFGNRLSGAFNAARREFNSPGY